MGKKLMVPQLSIRLIELELAEEQLGSEKIKLAEAVVPYEERREEIAHQMAELSGQLRGLDEAMLEDPIVAELRDRVREREEIRDKVLEQAKGEAVAAWSTGGTGGSKQWSQDQWDIRLRTTRTPTVADWQKFLRHVEKIEAGAIIREVKIKLDNGAALSLDKSIDGGLNGLQVVEKTSATLCRQA